MRDLKQLLTSDKLGSPATNQPLNSPCVWPFFRSFLQGPLSPSLRMRSRMYLNNPFALHSYFFRYLGTQAPPDLPLPHPAQIPAHRALGSPHCLAATLHPKLSRCLQHLWVGQIVHFLLWAGSTDCGHFLAWSLLLLLEK